VAERQRRREHDGGKRKGSWPWLAPHAVYKVGRGDWWRCSGGAESGSRAVTDGVADVRGTGNWWAQLKSPRATCRWTIARFLIFHDFQTSEL
jgi:hypothetical protein